MGLFSAAGLLAGCSSGRTPATLAGQVEAWSSSTSFGNGIGVLEADSANVQTVLADHDGAKELQTVCLIFGDDARTANENLPTPDQQLTDELAAGYSDDADAASDCYAGAAGSRSRLDRSAQERDRAAVALGAALSRMQVITGKTPSTTTTSQPGSSAGGDPFA